MRKLLLAALVLSGCAHRVTAPRGDCPGQQVLCRASVGIEPVGGVPLSCTDPCTPGESFGPGVGACDATGCPIYFVP